MEKHASTQTGKWNNCFHKIHKNKECHDSTDKQNQTLIKHSYDSICEALLTSLCSLFTTISPARFSTFIPFPLNCKKFVEQKCYLAVSRWENLSESHTILLQLFPLPFQFRHNIRIANDVLDDFFTQEFLQFPTTFQNE